MHLVYLKKGITTAERDSLINLIERQLEDGSYYGVRKHYRARLRRVKHLLETAEPRRGYAEVVWDERS